MSLSKRSSSICRPTLRRSAPSSGERIMTEAIALLFSSTSLDYVKSQPGFLTPTPEEFFGSAKAIEVSLRNSAPNPVRRVGFLTPGGGAAATNVEKQNFQKFLAFLQPPVVNSKSLPFSMPLSFVQAHQYLAIAVKALSVYCVFIDYSDDMYRTHVFEPLRWFMNLLFPKGSGFYEKIGAKVFQTVLFMIQEVQRTCRVSHKHIGELLHCYEKITDYATTGTVAPP